MLKDVVRLLSRLSGFHVNGSRRVYSLLTKKYLISIG